jgi:predicted nucleic acid-binding protein
MDLETASIYGKLVARVRRGRNLEGRSQNNLSIAATTLSAGATLLSRKPADFSGIEGVEVRAYTNSR